MIENVAAMFKPNPEKALEYAQEIAERTLRLARTQLEVTNKIYGEVSREYRDLLTSEEQSAMLQSWPKVVENATRTSAEGMASLLKNTIDYQNELIRMMQSRVPELNGQIFETFIQSTRAAAAMTDASVGRSARQSSGAANSPKASKAA